MIGTHSPVRPFVVFVTFALAAIGLALAWGCNDLPVSVPGTSSGSGTSSYYEVPRPDAHRGDLAETVGTVDAIDTAAMRLRVGHLWFRADSETEIQTEACDHGCPFADIHAGDAVKVKHERLPEGDGSYYAHEIEVENEDEDVEDPDADEAATEGTVEAVDEGAFQVAGAWFWTDSATEFEIDAACADPSIMIGDPVKVEHSTLDTAGFGFYAFKVEIKRDCEAPEEDDDTDDDDVAVTAR